MNVITRGIKNALRSPVRSFAIVVMLAISIGLIISMLVARSSVTTKINEVKASTATGITISPAGLMGGEGSGNALTADQVKQITAAAHVSRVSATLTDQLGTSDTNLTPSLELGNLGTRAQRFENSSSSSVQPSPTDSQNSTNTNSGTTTRQAPRSRTSVTGTTTPLMTTSGTSLTLTSGTTIDGTSSNLEALVGTTLATKNSLSVGSTFTAYGKTITVKGIYKTGNTFQDSGVIMPLATVQSLTDQVGAVSNVSVNVDSSDNVAGTVTALKATLGDKADITSQAEQAASSLAPLESIAGLSLAAVIGASIAAAVIILLTMIMVVRERRREIGVIKAIGGTNGKVVTQFIAEAITLTLIGAIIGFAVGVIASTPLTSSLVQTSTSSNSTTTRGFGGPGRSFNQINSNLRNVTASATPAVFVTGIGIVLLIAILGSAIPALLIARVRPAEVLRSE